MDFYVYLSTVYFLFTENVMDYLYTDKAAFSLCISRKLKFFVVVWITAKTNKKSYKTYLYQKQKRNNVNIVK